MEEGGDSSAEKSKGNVQLSIWLDFSLLQQPNIFLEKTVQVIILLISVFCPTLKTNPRISIQVLHYDENINSSQAY